MTEPAAAFCAACILIGSFAIAGLALINTGLGRSRNAAHAMLAALCAAGTAAVVYAICGFAWQGFPGLAEHSMMVHGKSWGWVGAGRFFLRGLDFDGSPAPLAAWFSFVAVALAAQIPLGAGGERWRLGPVCVSTALLAAFAFPLFSHWVWGGGWLEQLGANYGLGRGLTDAGGSGAIHAVGGMTALAIAWILGPRRGKFPHDGMPIAMPGHSSVLVLLGCLLAWIGSTGLNMAGAMLFTGAAMGRMAGIGMNTALSAAGAMLAVAGLTAARFGRPDASLCANGWVSGLVAGSASCASASPAAALFIGALAGCVTTYSIEWLEVYLKIDDPGGAISVHGVCGSWGLLAAGLFGGTGQPLAQLAGVATLAGFVLPLIYSVNSGVNRFYRYRVAPEAERQGLDLHELGAGAYPEFLTHIDEFTP